jgi:hypothetical protein
MDTMKDCKTCEKLIYDRAVIANRRPWPQDEAQIHDKRLCAHNLIKHFDWVVDLMTPKPLPDYMPMAALINALSGADERERVVRALTQYRDELILELKL